MATTIAVLGAGSWGTVMAHTAAQRGNPTLLWARRPEQAQDIQTTRVNHEYLPQLELSPNLTATSDDEAAIKAAEIILIAVPSTALQGVCERWAPWFDQSKHILVSLVKGLAGEGAKFPATVIHEATGFPMEKIAVLSGPNLSHEILAGQPAAAVIACASEENAQRVQSVLHTPRFRMYTNPDVIGTQVGGIVKNVIAIAVGASDGAGYGANARAALMIRGLAEITRLGVALGCDPLTFSGLSGMGDLLATCTSDLSRNRTVGYRVGKGETIEAILGSTNQVAEGVHTSKRVLELANTLSVEMPITERVVNVLHEGTPLHAAMESLMAREMKPEFRGIRD